MNNQKSSSPRNPITISKMMKEKYDQKIIDKYEELRDEGLENHSKLVQKRFDLTAPVGFELTPQHMYRFTDYLTRNLKRNNPLPDNGGKRSSGRQGIVPKHQLDPSIMLVREQNDPNRNFHVHGIVFFNGQARLNGYYVQKQIERVWNNLMGVTKKDSGLVNNPVQNGTDHIVMNRNEPDFEQKKQEAYTQALYLAKTRSKELNAKGSWRTTGSRMPKK
jgi:hypothetical protein